MHVVTALLQQVVETHGTVLYLQLKPREGPVTNVREVTVIEWQCFKFFVRF